jgi:hypothetical protein
MVERYDPSRVVDRERQHLEVCFRKKCAAPCLRAAHRRGASATVIAPR